MNTGASNEDKLPILEALKLLLDEWKFRQQHSWAILDRYGLAALVVSVAPYTVQDLLKSIGAKVFVFPAIGWVLGLWAIWLFAAEYAQCNPVLQNYRNMLSPYYPPERKFTGIRRIFNPPIGWLTATILVVIITLLELVNAYLLAGVARRGT